MSVPAAQGLKEKQEGARKLCLIQDVSTRWNSTYLIMDRLLLLRVPLYSTLLDERFTKVSDRRSLDIKDSFWDIMENITPVLRPFAEATEILGREDQPTASSVYVLVQDLVCNHLTIQDSDAGVVKDLKSKILEGMQKRYKISDDGKPTAEVLKGPQMIASCLDPRYKSLRFISEEDREELRKEIIRLVKKTKMDKNENAEKDDDDEEPQAKKPMFQCLLGDVTPQSSKDKSEEQEVADFFREPVHITEPFLWWMSHEKRFPNISVLAKKYLAIPATSVTSERIFSVAGLTVTNLRNALDPENVKEIIFVNKNMKDKDDI
jgi:hypothetical protein